MSFAAITLCVASQRVFIVAIVCFVIDSVRQLLVIPSYEYIKARSKPVEVYYGFLLVYSRRCLEGALSGFSLLPLATSKEFYSGRPKAVGRVGHIGH
jgi:hypothetical protein